MVFVPMAVAKFGVKNTMLLGAAAWALRFGLSAYGQPQWLMIATIALHGFAFGFFFVVAQMYVDRAASPDIKATAQNFLIFIVYGIGTIVGSVLTGRVREVFSSPSAPSAVVAADSSHARTMDTASSPGTGSRSSAAYRTPPLRTTLARKATARGWMPSRSSRTAAPTAPSPKRAARCGPAKERP